MNRIQWFIYSLLAIALVCTLVFAIAITKQRREKDSIFQSAVDDYNQGMYEKVMRNSYHYLTILPQSN